MLARTLIPTLGALYVTLAPPSGLGPIEAAPTRSGERAAPAALCEGPDVDPWVTGLRDRVLSFDGLAAFALERFGPVTACEGSVSMEFDGAKYGTVRLSFSGSATLEVQTMPPSVGVTTLSATPRLGTEEEARALLASYASGRGLAIAWDATPEVRMEDDRTVHTYWDPEPGLNASASLVYSGERVVGVRLSLAP